MAAAAAVPPHPERVYSSWSSAWAGEIDRGVSHPHGIHNYIAIHCNSNAGGPRFNLLDKDVLRIALEM